MFLTPVTASQAGDGGNRKMGSRRNTGNMGEVGRGKWGKKHIGRGIRNSQQQVLLGKLPPQRLVIPFPPVVVNIMMINGIGGGVTGIVVDAAADVAAVVVEVAIVKLIDR